MFSSPDVAAVVQCLVDLAVGGRRGPELHLVDSRVGAWRSMRDLVAAWGETMHGIVSGERFMAELVLTSRVVLCVLAEGSSE